MSMPNVAILILAAGSSSRMRTPKQLLPVNNTTLLGHTIENSIASKASIVCCVLGANFQKVKNNIKDNPIEIIYNPEYKNGLSTSLIEGIKHIQSKTYDAALVLLADQPKVDTNYINLLIDAYHSNSEAIIASSYSDSFGVPAVFPNPIFEQLLKLKGDKGAKAFLNSGKIKIKTINNADLTDIDTPEDYANFLNSI